IVFLILVVAAGIFMFRDRLFPPPPASSAERDSQTAASATAPDSAPAESKEIDHEAKKFIAKLTAPNADPLQVEKADHFITKDQIITLLPEGASEQTTREAIAADPSLSPDSPITVVKEVEQVEMTTPERIIAEAAGDLERKVRVLEGGEVKEYTAGEVLEQYRKNPDASIAIVKNVEYYEVTTPKELAEDSSIAKGEQIKIIRKPYRLEAASVADLLNEQEEVSPDSVFYVRTVRPTDEQGIWGIVHDGIIENFARGMAIRRGEEVNTYRVEIPRDADEKLKDESSSFLGKMIHDKTTRSYVYNFKQNRMGRNPDRVLPGQEIVIINFEPDELIQIYKHFASSQG
ncbi:MAG: hypothetical protein R3174_14720, partial [Gammaproteobacteria bacterium]|nr:hypothetical protein [Gammaproteobacteria bacterium]